MQFKVIDSKVKEIYYISHTIEEEASVVESRDLFWASLNNLAVQNISMRQLKMA